MAAFFHWLLEEEVLTAYYNVSNWEDREGIDGRNSSSRPKTAFELGANKFNDPGYEPASNACPDLHDDFLEPIDLLDDEEHTMPFVTPTKLKDQLALVRCKVSYYLFCH